MSRSFGRPKLRPPNHRFWPLWCCFGFGMSDCSIRPKRPKRRRITRCMTRAVILLLFSIVIELLLLCTITTRVSFSVAAFCPCHMHQMLVQGLIRVIHCQLPLAKCQCYKLINRTKAHQLRICELGMVRMGQLVIRRCFGTASAKLRLRRS